MRHAPFLYAYNVNNVEVRTFLFCGMVPRRKMIFLPLQKWSPAVASFRKRSFARCAVPPAVRSALRQQCTTVSSEIPVRFGIRRAGRPATRRRTTVSSASHEAPHAPIPGASGIPGRAPFAPDLYCPACPCCCHSPAGGTGTVVAPVSPIRLRVHRSRHPRP